MIKLAALTHSVAPSAAGMYFSLRDLHQSLANVAIMPQIYAMHGADIATLRADWQPVDIRICGDGIAGVKAIDRRLRVDVPDIIHLHGIWSVLSLLTRLHRHQAPLLISPHGMLDAWALRQKRLKKWIGLALVERTNMNKAACIVALNTAEAQAIRSLGVKAPIAIIPHGVHVPAATDLQHQSDYGPVRDKYILYIGRIDAKKGLRNLVEAMRIMKERHPRIADQYRLVLAGWNDNSYADELRNSIRQNRLEKDIIFAGAVFGSRKFDLLAKASAFILPSFSEGLPIAVLEAMSHGIPAFITPQCNLPESIARGGAIEISNDPPAMAQILAACLSDGKLLQKTGAAGLQYVLEQHQWRDVAERYQALYRWLLGQADRPDHVV